MPKTPPMNTNIIRSVAFIVRCSGAVTVAYLSASWLGLQESMWAAMFALIVSQERLYETRTSLADQVLGTLLGIAVAISVSAAASRFAVVVVAQMAVAVAIAAMITHKFRKLRPAVWTCPIIFLTAQPDMPMVMVAFYRASEVMLGAVIGWVFHWAAEVAVDALAGAAEGLRGWGAHQSERRQAMSDGAPHTKDLSP